MLDFTINMPKLTWTGKDKVINHHHEVPFRILDKQYTFKSEPSAVADGLSNESKLSKTNLQPSATADGSDNRIIHGDNLEALKSLLPEFEGKIKCIYIDPPYNTGNEGWIYNDNVNDEKIKKWLGNVVGKEGEDLSRQNRLKELIVKGFVLDDERLKSGGKMNYFDELLNRIRDIRSSEKVFYQKVKDIYLTSIDYAKDANTTREFFQVIQNKLHHAIHNRTAAELIKETVQHALACGMPNISTS